MVNARGLLWSSLGTLIFTFPPFLFNSHLYRLGEEDFLKKYDLTMESSYKVALDSVNKASDIKTRKKRH